MNLPTESYHGEPMALTGPNEHATPVAPLDPSVVNGMTLDVQPSARNLDGASNGEAPRADTSEDAMDVDSEPVVGPTTAPISSVTVDEEEEAELEDKYTPSDVSIGGDLKKDLETTLGGDFGFKGSFYYGRKASDAPSPCLNIDGLGNIGLPLSSQDARSIIECSTQAPFGHGERTIVDTNVRNTWEIEATRIKFDNPSWDTFIETKIIVRVQNALGVSAGSFQCELYKLLLYETGSHFLPHQDTEKAPGMFATVIIILPSPHTGGQVRLSHGSKTKILDMSSTSLISTTILAWYTDVMHEVKPVTSGYRLALSYNLIHTSSGVPRPMIPDMHGAIAKLHRVLRKWRKNTYKSDRKMIVYLLSHQYSSANIRKGVSALKGEDAHRIANMRIAAEDLGYVICLANLTCHVTGRPSDDFEYNEVPYMEEEDSRSITASNMVDLEGNPLPGLKKFPIEEDDLVPNDPFDDAVPDNKEYAGGYMGNSSGQLDYWYHRTVLILFHEDNVTNVLSSLGGVEYALFKLKQSTSATPTADDRKMARVTLDHLESLDSAATATMADYSIKWKDVEMWKAVIRTNNRPLSAFNISSLVEAWETFSFEGVRTSFEDMLSKFKRLGEQLDFIQALPLHTPPGSPEDYELVQTWSQEQFDRALSTFDAPTLEDVPALITIAHARGISALLTEILPQLARNDSVFKFCIAFVKSLHEHKRSILERPGFSTTPSLEDQKGESEDLNSLIERCLDISARQWSTLPPYSSFSFGVDGKIRQIVDVVETCLLTGHMGPCRKMLTVIPKVSGVAAKEFQTLYGPLIPRLRDLLQTHDVDICSSPFSDFLQLLIGTYLRDVLGTQSPNTYTRKFGCGCMDCDTVETFMASETTKETFRYARARRLHIERQLAGIPNFVYFESIRSGSPHGVQVIKNNGFVTASQWTSCVARAREFLNTIGDDDVLSKLMGNRYDDVMKALQGTQPFILTAEDTATATSVSQPAPAASQSSQTPTENTALTAMAAPMGGKQGKQSASVSSSPTTDLSADDDS